jgi:hypothetical protein
MDCLVGKEMVLSEFIPNENEILCFFVDRREKKRDESIPPSIFPPKDPPIEVWKIPIGERSLPKFDKALLLKKLPQMFIQKRPLSILVNVVGKRVYCFYNVCYSAGDGLVFDSFLLTDDYMKKIKSEEHTLVIYGKTLVRSESLGVPNPLSFNRGFTVCADTTMKKPLSLVIGKDGEITITAFGEDDSIVFSKSLDDGKTWSLPQKVYAEEKTGGQGEPAKVDNGSKVPLSKIEKDVKNDR